MTHLRVCYIQIGLIFFHEHGSNFLSGMANFLGNVCLENMNVTFEFVPKSRFGTLIDPISREYDGCIGSVQSNETDWALIQVPIGEHGPNLMTGPAMGFEQISILSSYNLTGDVVDTHILQAFNSFSTSLWIAVIFTTLLLTMMFATMFKICSWLADKFLMKENSMFVVLRRAMEKKVPTQRAGLLEYTGRSVKMMTSVMMKQPTAFTMRRRINFARLLLLSAILFSYWIQVYFCNLIKTELAVVRKPITIDTYDDILGKEDILPMWIALQNDKQLFQKAERGSKESQIWRKMLTITNGSIDQALMTMDPAGMATVLERGVQQKAALLIGRYLQTMARSNFCSAQAAASSSEEEEESQSDVYLSRLTTDPGAREYVRVFFYNSNLPQEIKDLIHRITTKRVEHGLFDHVSSIMVPIIPTPPEERMRMCLSDIIITKLPEIHVPLITHYVSLFLLTIALISLALLKLVHECYSA